MSAIPKATQNSWLPKVLRFDNQQKTKLAHAVKITAVVVVILSQVACAVGAATCCNAEGGQCYTCEPAPPAPPSSYDENGMWIVPDWIANVIDELAQNWAGM